MISSSPASDSTEAERPGPYAALAARARRASDGGLAISTAAGCLYLALLLVWRPAWWQFVVAPLAIGFFGVWGIADRERTAATDPSRRRLLGALRAIAAFGGTLAVALSAFRILGALVGTVIS